MNKLSKMKGAALILLMSCGIASAETSRCEYDNWEGADRNTAVNILGHGFDLGTASGVAGVVATTGGVLAVRLFVDGGAGATDWVGVRRVIEANDFVTYRVNGPDFGYEDSQFSFRLYQNGTCSVALTGDGYYPVRATGLW